MKTYAILYIYIYTHIPVQSVYITVVRYEMV